MNTTFQFFQAQFDRIDRAITQWMAQYGLR